MLQRIKVHGPVSLNGLSVLACCASPIRISLSGISNLDQTAFEILASIERLVELTIDIPPDLSLIMPDELPIFPALEFLEIEGDMFNIASILSSVTSTVLNTVKICYADFGRLGIAEFQEEMLQWRACLEILVSNPHIRDTLRHIEGFTARPCEKYSDSIGASFFLEPLLELRNLEDLRFCIGFNHLCLKDADVQTLVTAWPLITRLELPLTEGVIRPTFAALHSLADHCPHLETLNISVDFRELPTTPVPFSQHSLRNLDMGQSIFSENRDEAVLALRRLFPALDSIHTCQPSMDE
jgi:hypothetical protein